MGNAAKAPAPAPSDQMGVWFQKTDGKIFTMNCGNFLYREAGPQEGGPIILTLLKESDRKSPTNEPFMIITRVMEFEAGEPFDADADAAARAERMARRSLPDEDRPIPGRPAGLMPSA